MANYPSGNLEPGMSGSQVKQLQEYLISMGYSIPDGATGYYGNQTKAAVTQLQNDLGVDTGGYDGYWGPKTQSSLTKMTGDVGTNIGSETTPVTTQPTNQNLPQVYIGNQEELDKYKALGYTIKSDPNGYGAIGIPPGANTPPATPAIPADQVIKKTGDPVLDAAIEQMQKLVAQQNAQGKKLNPALDWSDPAVRKRFVDQAENELGPYYKTLFKAAKEDIYSYMDQVQKDYELKAKAATEDYKRTLGTQREAAAGAGTIFSGARNLGEIQTTEAANRGLESLYNAQSYDVGSKLRDYTYKYGTDQGLTQPVNQYGVSNVGKGSQYSRQLNTLTPESAVTGSEEFKARTAKDVYAKEAAKWASEYENVNKY